MPTQTCDCIRITYQLVGGEPVTVEVEKEPTQVNGKNRYDFNVVEGVNGALTWNPDLGVGASWFYSDGDNIAYNTLDTDCPFGVYTIEAGSIFSAFVVQPCETEEDRIINCYRLAVWSKQCEYSKCVLEYVNNLIFGLEVCKLQESLKEQRRALEILNCYDPRDILGNTTNYNTITYTKIKQLLNHL